MLEAIILFLFGVIVGLAVNIAKHPIYIWLEERREKRRLKAIRKLAAGLKATLTIPRTNWFSLNADSDLSFME